MEKADGSDRVAGVNAERGKRQQETDAEAHTNGSSRFQTLRRHPHFRELYYC
jgi:hypothetical protein